MKYLLMTLALLGSINAHAVKFGCIFTDITGDGGFGGGNIDVDVKLNEETKVLKFVSGNHVSLLTDGQEVLLTIKTSRGYIETASTIDKDAKIGIIDGEIQNNVSCRVDKSDN